MPLSTCLSQTSSSHRASSTVHFNKVQPQPINYAFVLCQHDVLAQRAFGTAMFFAAVEVGMKDRTEISYQDSQRLYHDTEKEMTCVATGTKGIVRPMVGQLESTQFLVMHD